LPIAVAYHIRALCLNRSTDLNANSCTPGLQEHIMSDKRTKATCPLDLCHSVGRWPLFLTFWASAQPAASIFGPSGLNSIQASRQHYGRSSMRCSADDASP